MAWATGCSRCWRTAARSVTARVGVGFVDVVHVGDRAAAAGIRELPQRDEGRVVGGGRFRDLQTGGVDLSASGCSRTCRCNVWTSAGLDGVRVHHRTADPVLHGLGGDVGRKPCRRAGGATLSGGDHNAGCRPRGHRCAGSGDCRCGWSSWRAEFFVVAQTLIRVPVVKHTLRVLVVLLSLVVTAGCGSKSESPSAGGGQLIVFAAASLKGTFTDIGKQFQNDNPGASVEFSFAGSSDLATQLVQGAQADVFASADTKSMDKAAQAGLLAANPVNFASNTLTIAVAPGNPKKITT